MHRNCLTRTCPWQHHPRRGEQGQANLIIALGLVLLLFVFFTVLDVGLVEAAHQRVAGYAEQVALAAVEAATRLNGFGTGGSSSPQLDPRAAVDQAHAFFQGLALGPTFSLSIVAATTAQLTVQVSATQAIFLWPGPVNVSAAATEVPQADTT